MRFVLFSALRVVVSQVARLRLLVALTALLVGGCALIHRLDDYSFADESSPASIHDADAGGGDGGEPAECRSNRDCAALAPLGSVSSDASGLSRCVLATGKCERLLTPECPRIAGDAISDDAIVIGALLRDGNDPTTEALEAAAFLAVEEMNSPEGAGGLPGPDGGVRPLLVVGCDTSGDVMAAARHLVDDLRVAAIVGPTAGEHVVDVTQQVSARGGTLLMTPASVVSAISDLADEGLTWRTVPSDAQRAKLVIEEMKELEALLRTTRGLETVKLAIVHATDAAGTSAYDAIRGKLILNNRFITDAANEANVSVDAHETGDTAALASIATKYAVGFKPDIVFITAPEQIAGLLVPLEKALTAARALYRPYYVVTEAAKTKELLDVMRSSDVPPDTRRRVRGVGLKPDAASAPVLAEFEAAFAARYGTAPLTPTAAASLSYDATYAIAYALAATPDQAPSGAVVAQGLRALGVGDPVTVGPKATREAFQQLASRKSVSLRGTFSKMQWDASGDLTAGTVEIWCVGTKDGAPSFGSSGLTMDVNTQVVGGAFVQCQ